MVDTVLLAEPRGFCAGVEMAIKALTWMVQVFEPPIYCYHEIVHNSSVVEAFEEAGVVFVDDISEVPKGSAVMLSAHGSGPDVVTAAGDRAAIMVDAVCPLVTKVHHEVRRMAGDGFDILYVGHAGHDEAVGTIAEAPEAVRLVEPEQSLDEFFAADASRVALLAQTTLGLYEWEGILAEAQERYPKLVTARRSDLCYATTNRQTAVQELAERCDLVLVVGSANSSNTQALVRVANAAGVPAHRVDGPQDVDPAWLERARTVGVTAGASAPDQTVRAVVDAVAPDSSIEVLSVLAEDEYFPLPPALRTLLSALVAAVAAGYGAEPNSHGGPLDTDRTFGATAALDVLASSAA